MPLQKQNIPINFAMGVDTKTDPFQLNIGSFENLENTIFQKGKLLQKRNGFEALTPLPDDTNKFITTFNGNLTAIGTTLNAYSAGSQTWGSKGPIVPISLNTKTLIRNNTYQTQCDSAIAPNGLVCTVYTDVTPSGTLYRYSILDSVTSQSIIAPVSLVSVTGSPRVFVLNNYFIIVYPATNSLRYIAVSLSSPSTVTSPVDISTVMSYSAGGNFDGIVANSNLYLAWNGTDGGGAIRYNYLDSTLTLHTTKVLAGKVATLMSVNADISQNSPAIGIFFYDSASTNGYILTIDSHLNTIQAAKLAISAEAGILNITLAGVNQRFVLMHEIPGTYSYDGAIQTHRVVGRGYNWHTDNYDNGGYSLDYSVGLASKAFLINETVYVLLVYSSTYQPTYFLADELGNIVAKLAYSNGAGYLTLGLPSVTLTDDVASIAYLTKTMITAVNKDTNVPAGTQTAGIYAQVGVNLSFFDFSPTRLSTSEIGNNLNISGGFLWMYDGVIPVEQGFHLYPDYVEVTTNAAGGSITAQKYFYVATYEWQDNQGNIFRSSPSIPVSITTTGGTSTNTINVPYLRLTYKIASPVKLVVYRWSTAQQTYYQVTSITSPILNQVTTDSIAIVDTASDATILGNNILYTTGGVVENIAPPATDAMALYKSRLFLIDAEDRNLVWYSKQVIESTPVEMSDLFTIFVAPTIGAQGNTGPLLALSAMDDKLIFFKKNAIYYMVGNGPDNTGTNNDFSEPVFITSTVGSSNQNSIVFIPNGLMFESDKGIWLLGRDLSTSYVGAPVEAFTNGTTVLSAIAVPGTNQVRFTLSSGITLEYDYFYNQWGTFTNIPGISSTLYENLHTFIDSSGDVFQESINSFLDGSKPTLISLTTGWINVTGLQGLERVYDFTLLGTFLSPHKLTVQVAYDYNPSPTQSTIITPLNIINVYGSDPLYGDSSPYGGNSSVEQWRVFFQRQKCQAIQITIIESYDPSQGQPAGAGFTLSGLNITVGLKKTYPRLKAAVQVG